jgi:hypothetical protein
MLAPPGTGPGSRTDVGGGLRSDGEVSVTRPRARFSKRFAYRSCARSLAGAAASALVLLAGGAAAPAASARQQDDDRPLGLADRELNRTLSEARDAEDPIAIADALLAKLAARPEAIDGLGPVAIVDLQAGLQRLEARDAERRVLEALFARDWTPRGSIVSRPGAFDVRLALLRIEDGDVAGARAALAGVWRAGDVVDVLIDRRFEPLWAELEAAGAADAAAAVERARAEAVALALEHPRSLEPALFEMGALRQAGRAAEAAAIGRAARQHFVSAAQPAYDDALSYKIVILNLLATALTDMGETAEALGAIRAAGEVDAPLRGGRVRGPSEDASQALNAALLLVWDGQARDARRRLSGVSRSRLSDFGVLQAQALRACAAAQLGDEAELAERLAELERARDDNVEALHLALMCADRLDDAAALTLWRLETEKHRLGALRMLQVYRAPARTPAYKATLDARLAALRERPDVAAAAERVGRIMSWELVQ